MRLPLQSSHPVLIRPLGGSQERWFRTAVVDFEENENLLIALPLASDLVRERSPSRTAVGTAEEQAAENTVLAEQHFTGFAVGARLEVEITFADGIRRFQVGIQRRESKFGGSIRVDWPTEGSRIQRREFVRVEIFHPVTLRYESAEPPGIVKLTGSTSDFSAGGVRVRVPERIPTGAVVELEFGGGTLPAQTLQGRVVATGELSPGPKQTAPGYWAGIEFRSVTPGLRKEMTQLVFDIQREQLRRSR
jgi:hypothetical protein